MGERLGQVFSNGWPGDAFTESYCHKRVINEAYPVDSKIMGSSRILDESFPECQSLGSVLLSFKSSFASDGRFGRMPMLSFTGFLDGGMM